MFFVSTPSLLIYVILAVFYIANLAFYAVNRQQDTAPSAITTGMNAENRYDPQQPTTRLLAENHTPKHKSSCDTYSAPLCALRFLASAPVPTGVAYALPCGNPILFDPAICGKQFSRPPPDED